jgi:DNA polymerase-3 subunit delta'
MDRVNGAETLGRRGRARGGDALRPDAGAARPAAGAAGADGRDRPDARAHRAGEDAVLSRLAPDPHAARAWAELAADLTARARRGKAVNLDPAALIFDMFLDLDRTAERLAVPAA